MTTKAVTVAAPSRPTPSDAERVAYAEELAQALANLLVAHWRRRHSEDARSPARQETAQSIASSTKGTAA